jgi:hypothetical protein
MRQFTSKTKNFAKYYGIGVDSGEAFLQPAVDIRRPGIAMDDALQMAMDAPVNLLQAGLVTMGNAGIPAYLANYLDPEVVRVFTAPLKAVEIFGEQKKGDWTTDTAQFPLIESTGEVSSYGDDDDNGLAQANVNWEPRQSYHYQIFTRWGDKEMAKVGLAKIDWAAEQNVSSALIMNIFQNKTYFLGVAGLSNYGLLNDPSLPASISPLNGAWTSATTGVQIFEDIQNMFVTLQLQLDGNIEMEDELKLCLPPSKQPFLLTPMLNTFGTATVKQFLKEAFPKLQILTAVQYTLSTGVNTAQLIAPSVQGQKTGFCAFTEKSRSHAIVRKTSSTHQKKSGGTWGAIIKVPAAIVTLSGI